MRPNPEKAQSKRDAQKPLVYVYGGGVAGMTAAHELAIRGFEVHVYEQERALGPRGSLEDLTLGGMARTQYFATTQAQRLYFHVDPLKSLLERLPLQSDVEILQQLSRDDTRKRLLDFFESVFRELQGEPSDEDSRDFQGVLAQVLEGANLPAFSQALQAELKGERDLKRLQSLLSMHSVEVDELVGSARAYLSKLPTSTSRQVGTRLSGVFARALVGVGGGGPAVAFVKQLAALAASTGPLPERMSESLQAFLRELLPPIDPRASLLLPFKAGGASLREMFERFMATRMSSVLPGQGPEAASYFPEYWVEFKPRANSRDTPVLTPESAEGLDNLIKYVNGLNEEKYFSTELGKPIDIQILVQSFVDPSLSAAPKLPNVATELGTFANAQASSLADVVIGRLNDESNGLKGALKDKVEPYEKSGGFLKAYSALGIAPTARDWVRVIFYRPQLPGEHGYRFFPSYYRHVFDTMRRIPLHDAGGQPTGGSVLDNLVPLPQIGIFTERSAPFLMSWSPSQVGDTLSRAAYNRRNMARLDINSQDLLQFSLRILRYMTSSSRRRAAEMEDLSWWEYLEGRDAKTGTRLYRYSQAFEHLVKSSSRVLAAFDGANGDARTCGNTYVQLLTQTLVPTEQNNCTLNGPTSEAWFLHWRKHLEHLKVEFCHGELQKLEVKDGRLVARVRKFPNTQAEPTEEWHGDEPGGRPVYFVVATDLLSAARAVEGLPLEMSKQLQRFAFKVPKKKGSTGLVVRRPEKPSRRKPWDRLQTISGIQYFFEKHVNVFDGYLYCVDAEWGLSAICSHLVWQDRPMGTLSPYQSILSVDIGDWNTPSKHLKLAAWQCSPRQLEKEVFRQLCASLGARGAGHDPAGFVLPRPDWVHIDESLVFDSLRRPKGPEGKASLRKLRKNKVPYLVPIAGDWKHRPGPEPWDPTPEAARPPHWHHRDEKAVWQAPHGGYPVHYDRLVFAGTYLRTFTRMTTMESANESARHAVNAILDHLTAHGTQSAATRGFWRSPQATGPYVSNPYEKGVFPSTPHGDYCRIWNPEENELPDLELLQEQDEKNFRDGRSHPMDALGLEVLPSMLTHVPGAEGAYDHVMKWVASHGAAVPQVTHGLLAMLRHLRTMLESARPPRGY